jgi:phosphoribosylaminoimidazolecarboxamide formyltransferase/IMP cyclohydrolase
MELRSLLGRRSRGGLDFKRIKGGLLVQDADDESDDPQTWDVVTHRKPSDKEIAACEFGWKVVKYVKSNAVVFTTQDRTIGIGGGQMSRVDSAELALKKARGIGAYTVGTAMASDGFFPFADSVDEGQRGYRCLQRKRYCHDIDQEEAFQALVLSGVEGG